MEKIFIGYTFNSQVLGVVGDEIIIEGWVHQMNDTHDVDNAILVLKTNVYFDSLTKWIEEKRDYCERYGHFCGFGIMDAETERKYTSKYGEEYYDCTSIENVDIDMEHG